MLVLSRKQRESVVVAAADGRERMVTVTVLNVKGQKVRLGFEARADLPVHRSEVWEQIQARGRPEGLRS